MVVLCEFTDQSETNPLPFTPMLPVTKSDTANHIHWQRLYKMRAEEKQVFKSHLRAPVDNGLLGLLVKDAYALHVLRGAPCGVLDRDRTALGTCIASVLLRCG